MTANEDFLFAQEALALGFVTEAQVEEALSLQRRMSEDLRLDERLAVLLAKRGYLSEEQVRRVDARIQPKQGGPGEIQGYRLLDVLGRGAMGTVYRAQHLGLNRIVAIKVLRQDLAGDPTQVERLRAEAAILGSLEHPNVVRAFDAGVSNGFPFVVMEYVDGETLRDRLHREGPFPEREALRITRALADALERARRMGVVHRDIKPGNVLLSRAGVPKLMDLGLAKGPVDLGLTQHGATVGTPQYIAPEQAMDPRKADTRSDIYALGATLYAMLTGRPPYDGQTLAEILTKVLYQSPPPVRSLRPDVSPEAGYLVERMMLRDPDLRYRTPALVVQDLDRLLDGASILPDGFTGNWEAYLVRRRARRVALVAGGAILAGALLAVGVKLVQDRTRFADGRDVAERRVEALRSVAPTDDGPAIEARREEARLLLEDAERYDARNLPLLRRRLAEYDNEAALLRRVARAATEAAEAAAAGDHAAAERVLVGVETPPLRGLGPARAAYAALVAAHREASDAALGEAVSRRLLVRPTSMAAVAASLRAAADDTERFARTPRQRALRDSLSSAMGAAARTAEVLGQAERSLGPAHADEYVEKERFASLRRNLRLRRAEVDAELESAVPALTRPPESFYSAELLRALVAAPFAALEAAWRERVAEHVQATEEWADAQFEAGALKEALDRLERTARAAQEDDAYPDLARALHEHHRELADRRKQDLAVADSELNTLTTDVVAALRRDDPDALEARLREAHDDARLRPVAADVARLDDVATAWRALRRRVFDALASRIGGGEARYLDELRLEGGKIERRLEITSVDEEAREFTARSHRGMMEHPAVTIPLAAVLTSELERLVGLDPTVPADEFARGLLGLARWSRDEPDPRVRRDTLRAVLDRLAAVGEHPLGAWIAVAVESADAEVRRDDEDALGHWNSARKQMAQSRYPEAHLHYRELLRVPLSFSETTRVHRVEIRAGLDEIERKLQVNVLELILTAHVDARPSPTTPGALDVQVVNDFDTEEQLTAFSAGYGRIEPAPVGRQTTPGSSAGNLALRLLPDAEGNVVTDRPLAREAFLDPSVQSSVSFVYWPLGNPHFLGIDLDGCHVGILSADPHATPFPSDVPTLEGERAAPKFDAYGRGRGVLFHVGRDLGDPWRWEWPDAHQGRHFLPPELNRAGRRDRLETDYFAFEAHAARPYVVRFTRIPEGTDRATLVLEVDGRERLRKTREEYRGAKRSGRFQVLTHTTCVIDDLTFAGRLDRGWFEENRRRLESGAGTPPRPTK